MVGCGVWGVGYAYGVCDGQVVSNVECGGCVMSGMWYVVCVVCGVGRVVCDVLMCDEGFVRCLMWGLGCGVWGV